MEAMTGLDWLEAAVWIAGFFAAVCVALWWYGPRTGGKQ